MNNELVFSHSGDAGDLIMGCSAIKAMGGGDLILYPEPRRTRLPMSLKSFENIKPLLDLQPYIKSVVYMDRLPVNKPHSVGHNINGFRDHLKGVMNIADAHLNTLGLSLHHRMKPWIIVDYPLVNIETPILFSKTPRYINQYFPWGKCYDKYKDKAAFVGLPEEHKTFEKLYGSLPYFQTKDLLELARLIAGCKLLISNENCSHAIGEALKKTMILAAQDNFSSVCQFPRMNKITCFRVSPELPEIEDLI